MAKNIADRPGGDPSDPDPVPFTVRAFLFQPFSIPAQSMVPTLLVGDHFLCRQICLWLHPLFAAVFSKTVFRPHLRLRAGAWRRRGLPRPKNDSVDYIKRVVGLPATASR